MEDLDFSLGLDDLNDVSETGLELEEELEEEELKKDGLEEEKLEEEEELKDMEMEEEELEEAQELEEVYKVYYILPPL